MAADSAVTISPSGTSKIYNTANKLFTLSKYHPVGIMVYGTAELMGIPWETVIKIYRRGLHVQHFGSLIQFAEHFFSFLESNRSLFPDEARESTFLSACEYILSIIVKTIQDNVKREIDDHGAVDDDGVDRLVKEAVESEVREWDSSYHRLDCFPEGFEEALIVRYGAALNGLVDRLFGQLPISDVREQLLTICASRATKNWWSLSAGGIVIAGFGQNDTFPAAHTFTVEFIVHDRLKREHVDSMSYDINITGGSTIIPFAQAEIVHRFIRGIDPEYKREQMSFLRNLLTSEYPVQLLQQFQARLTEEERRDIQAEIIRMGRAVLSQYDEQWSAWEHGKFIAPVLDIVGSLPKEDLAEMAESLVNLTSFKRKITAEAETVGGPIDVAVISKGDGFIWIKRKHYFNKDLNPTFFANYFRRDEP